LRPPKLLGPGFCIYFPRNRIETNICRKQNISTVEIKSDDLMACNTERPHYANRDRNVSRQARAVKGVGGVRVVITYTFATTV
jgi:hypothetical protein